MNAVTLYTLPSLVLVVSLVALTLASLSIQSSQKLTKEIDKAGQPLTSIASINGFSSSNQNNEAVLKTSIEDGLMIGLGVGTITQASSINITSVKLTGFQMDQSGTAIAVTDTLLQGIQKCTQLTNTPLSGISLTTPGTVTPNETVFSGLQILASSIPAITPYIFLSTGLATVINTTAPLWPSPYFGGTSLSLQVGTSFFFETWGNCSNAGGVTKTLTINFIFDGQTTSLTSSWSTNATPLVIQTFGAANLNQVYLVHRLTGMSTGGTTLALATQQTISLPANNSLSFAMTGTTVGLTLTTQGGSGTYLYR